MTGRAMIGAKVCVAVVAAAGVMGFAGTARADLPSLVVTIDPTACPGTNIGPAPTTTPFNVLFKNPTATPGIVSVQNFSASGDPLVFQQTVPAGGQVVWSPTFTGQAYICGGNCCPANPPTTQLFQVPQVPTNGCRIGGPVQVVGPGYPVGAVTQAQVTVDYQEPIPFLSMTPSDFSMTVQMVPPPLASQLNAPWLWGPPLHTMGVNEGPDVLSQVDDGGRIVINYGPCGTLTDSFQVTSVAPYQLSHSISGNLDLSAFANIAPGAALFRDVTTMFTTTGGTGTVNLGVVATGQVLCRGTLTITYNPGQSHPVVQLPAKYHSRLEFNAVTISGGFTGTRVRTLVPPVPAVGLGGIGALAVVLLLAALWLHRSRGDRAPAR
jgi:hypothetical protein